jgi:hypothetical protein
MYIPKKVNILGEFYRLIPKKNLSQDLSDDIGPIGALTDGANRDIFFDPKINNADLMQSLIHEIKHGHQWESGIFQVMERGIREVDAETTAKMLCNIFNITFKTK